MSRVEAMARQVWRDPMHDNVKRAKKPKTLLELESGDCRWPIGEPRDPDFRFCGAPQRPDCSYCERHWRIAFLPARPRYHTATATAGST